MVKSFLMARLRLPRKKDVITTITIIIASIITIVIAVAETVEEVTTGAAVKILAKEEIK